MPKNVKIDGNKLYREILPIMKSHNMTLSSFGEDLGYCKSYMSNSIRHNNVSSVTIGLLQAKWGINPESYVVKDGKEIEEKPTNETNPDLIYESVKNGIIDGFDEIKDELRKIIHDEVYSSVKEVLEE